LNHNVENSNSEKATSEFSSNFSITKEERIRRRNAKKRRRDDRKIIQKIATGNKDRPPAVPMMQIGGGEGSNSKKSLLQLSETMSDVVSTIHPTMNVFHNHRKNSLLLKSQYVADDESKKRGKATVGGGRMSDDIVQPRNRDYGGLGLARPSLLLLLTDPSFIPKLEEEFSEHVTGFFGKQRTKVMKKQLDGNMLWRRLQLAKKQGTNNTTTNNGNNKTDSAANFCMKLKIDGKKLSDMNPDERVEALIKMEMI